MDGYISGQGLNRDAINRDGWLSTGDLGFVDADGFIFIVDRLKDVINRAGENISAAEVESCLLHHEDVLEVAVFGMPDEEMGEAVVAVVSLKLGAEANEAELKKFVGQHLAAYKVPSRVQVMEEKLPRNPAGKLLKNKLKAQLFS
jgi:long-chain acyl-CoA synthetase